MCTRKVGSRITCEFQKTSYVCSVGKARYNRHTGVYKVGTLYYPLLCITLVIVWESLQSQLEKSTKKVIDCVTFTSTCTCSCAQIHGIAFTSSCRSKLTLTACTLPHHYWAHAMQCNIVSVSQDIECSLTHSLSHPPTLPLIILRVSL